MTTYVLEYGAGPQHANIATPDDLDTVLDTAVADATRHGVAYEAYLFGPAGEAGPVLHFGVGNPDFSFLSCGAYVVLGELDHGQPSEWYYGNQLGELPPGIGIGNDLVRTAAREFVETGQLPTSVDWIEDAGP